VLTSGIGVLFVVDRLWKSQTLVGQDYSSLSTKTITSIIFSSMKALNRSSTSPLGVFPISGNANYSAATNVVRTITLK